MRNTREIHVAEKVAARILFGVGALAAAAVFMRMLPELVRYMRVRQM